MTTLIFIAMMAIQPPDSLNYWLAANDASEEIDYFRPDKPTEIPHYEVSRPPEYERGLPVETEYRPYPMYVEGDIPKPDILLTIKLTKDGKEVGRMHYMSDGTMSLEYAGKTLNNLYLPAGVRGFDGAEPNIARIDGVPKFLGDTKPEKWFGWFQSKSGDYTLKRADGIFRYTPNGLELIRLKLSEYYPENERNE